MQVLPVPKDILCTKKNKCEQTNMLSELATPGFHHVHSKQGICASMCLLQNGENCTKTPRLPQAQNQYKTALMKHLVQEMPILNHLYLSIYVSSVKCDGKGHKHNSKADQLHDLGLSFSWSSVLLSFFRVGQWCPRTAALVAFAKHAAYISSLDPSQAKNCRYQELQQAPYAIYSKISHWNDRC